jgi:hypothetical protein
VRANSRELGLTPEEIQLLLHGLGEWGGPAFATQELAVAMGFNDLEDMEHHGRRLQAAISNRESLSAEDWTRALAATEIAFVSEVWGSGWDWSITQGYGDEQTITRLRGLQYKLRTAGAITKPGHR